MNRPPVSHHEIEAERDELKRRLWQLQGALRASSDELSTLTAERDALRRTLDVGQMLIVELAADGTVKFINQRGAELLGYSPEEVIGRCWFATFVPEPVREWVRGTFGLLMSGEGALVERYDNPVLTRTGEERDVAWHNTLVRDSSGAIRGTLSSGTDVTERKRTERRLKQARDHLQALYDASPDMIFVHARDGHLLDVNQNTMREYGYSRAELIAVHPEALMGEGFTLEMANECVRRALEGATVEFEWMARRSNGQEFPVEVRLRPFKDTPPESDDVPAVVAVVRDLTERKLAERERLRMEKLESLGVLAGGIAHDFNNILTSVVGHLSLARLEGTPGRSSEILQKAERAALKARDLTQQLLTFARGGTPSRRRASIVELVAETAGFVLRGSNVRCDLSFPDDIWPVEVDEGQMSQVVHNLVINADHAMPEGGVIRIRGGNVMVAEGDPRPLLPGRHVEVVVEDEGVGIAPDDVPRVFDPYFTTKERGAGLGLATSYSIVKKHGGCIAVESTVGAGTRFTLVLPASTGAIPREQEQEGVATRGAGRVLVMDDEAMIREVLESMLAHLGYQTELVRDGAEAIRCYTEAMREGAPFDLVIMDLTIPGGVGGKEAIRRLREIDPDVKAIVSSGYANAPIMTSYERYGFKGVVAKPFQIKDLAVTLARLQRP